MDKLFGSHPLGDSSSRDHGLKLKLGSSPVDLVSLEANEGLSCHFEVFLTVISPLEDFELLPNLGKVGSVTLSVDDRAVRHYSGLMSEGEHIGRMEGLGQLYRVKLSPLALFHEQGCNFRIFQDKSVKEIITAVLNGCGIKHDFKAAGGLRKRAYCVQYGESDFSFVSRLLEEHGLFYFYKHSDSGHEMVICDNSSQIEPSPVSELIYAPDMTGEITFDELLASNQGYVASFHETAVSSAVAKVTFRDFDFKVPATSREAMTELPKKHDEDLTEFFDWPGRYYINSEGQDLTKFKLEAARAQRVTFKGVGGNPGICAGHKVTFSKHDIERLNKTYLVLSTRTVMKDNAYQSSMGLGESSMEFTAIQIDVPFRAPMATPRPTAAGPETAIVTGPDNEEIHVDEWGRIKVHFHWDRDNPKDDTSSCWIRVSQTGGLGNMIIPRVGQEVLVDFVNGDPDRPIVVGRVYNEEVKLYHKLPAHKTRAVWRTKTYKRPAGPPDLQSANFADQSSLSKDSVANEIYMDDKDGAEEIYIHAERDLNTRVRKDEKHFVKENVTIEVGKDRKETVFENENIEIKKNRDEKVGGNETIKIDGKQEITVGDSIKITAGSKITLICGASTIEITPSKISFSSPTIESNATGQTKIASGGQTQVTAGGRVAVSAPMVMIN